MAVYQQDWFEPLPKFDAVAVLPEVAAGTLSSELREAAAALSVWADMLVARNAADPSDREELSADQRAKNGLQLRRRREGEETRWEGRERRREKRRGRDEESRGEGRGFGL